MSEGKPLTKERREYLRDEFVKEGFAIWIDEVLDGEAFWREAVKNAQECPSDDCAFCGVHCAGSVREHTPDCPWVLAQDGKR